MAIVRKDIRDPVSVGRTEWRPVGIKLRIGGTGQGEGRRAILSLLEAKQIGYALLLEAEKLDAEQRREDREAMERKIAKKADQSESLHEH